MDPRAFLFLTAKRRVYRCQFTKDLTLIGSDRSNDIVIRDASVVSEHARISKANDVYTLRAIEGSDVRINGEEIDEGHELENGDWIDVGDIQMLFAREYASSPVTVHLLIRRGGEPPMGFWTSKSTIVIGREKGDIIIDDPSLSPVHAVIENYCVDGWFVLNASSERETSVNAEAIDARHALQDKDTITLGGIEIEFRSRPFGNPSGQEAARFAYERVEQLRALKTDSAHSGPPGQLLSRNPYQRYPSEVIGLPEKDAPTAVRANAKTPRQGDRRRRQSWSSRPATVTRAAGNDSSKPAARGKLASQSIRAGLETGIFQTPSSPRTSAAPYQASTRNNDRTMRRGYEGRAPLPKLQPHQADEQKNKKRSFAARSELQTRMSGDILDPNGPWYLPPGSDQPKRRRNTAKPIIAARGDEVPKQSPSSAKSLRRPSPASPSNKRKNAITVPPMSARGAAPLSRMKTAGPNLQSAQQEYPVRKIPTDHPRAPGRRPDGKERWYAPNAGDEQMRQRRGNPQWYLPPDAEESSSEPDGKQESSRRNRNKGSTQVFDGQDYEG